MIIQKMVTRTVDVIDGDNFASLVAAIFGCKSCDKTKTGWQNKIYSGNLNVSFNRKMDYHKLLDNVPNLSSARYRGRLIAYATYIINYKSDKEVAERSKEGSSNYYDRFIQEAYNIANEEERDLMTKAPFPWVEKKYGTKNEDFCYGAEGGYRNHLWQSMEFAVS